MPFPTSPVQQRLLAPTRDGLLPVALRRDLADLNTQYLELGLLAGPAPDARFGWSEPVRRCIADTDPAIRACMATSPFALFQVAIPGTPPWEHPPRVEDGRPTVAPGAFHARCLSFAHQVAFLAMRLVEGSPLAGRLVLDLSPVGEAWLRELRPSQVADVAADPGLIRPRWPMHERFWAMLAGAARRGSPEALRWTHCVGLCLLGSDEATAPTGDSTTRRGARR